jgi:hypothetical protein
MAKDDLICGVPLEPMASFVNTTKREGSISNVQNGWSTLEEVHDPSGSGSTEHLHRLYLLLATPRDTPIRKRRR